MEWNDPSVGMTDEEFEATTPLEQDDAADTIDLNQLLGDEPAENEGDGDPAPEVVEQPQVYKTQTEIDSAMGKVRQAARDKVLKDHADDLELARIVKAAYPAATKDELFAHAKELRNEALGLSPEVATVFDTLNKRIDDLTATPVEEEPAEETPTDTSQFDVGAYITGWVKENVAQSDPGFNPVEFFGTPGNEQLLYDIANGRKSMGDVYAKYRLPELVNTTLNSGKRQQAATRNAQTPAPMRTGSPAATMERNISRLSDKDFDKLDAEIQTRLQRGEKVRL